MIEKIQDKINEMIASSPMKSLHVGMSFRSRRKGAAQIIA